MCLLAFCVSLPYAFYWFSFRMEHTDRFDPEHKGLQEVTGDLEHRWQNWFQDTGDKFQLRADEKEPGHPHCASTHRPQYGFGWEAQAFAQADSLTRTFYALLWS